MKITKNYLKKIILEEVSLLLESREIENKGMEIVGQWLKQELGPDANDENIRNQTPKISPEEQQRVWLSARNFLKEVTSYQFLNQDQSSYARRALMLLKTYKLPQFIHDSFKKLVNIDRSLAKPADFNQKYQEILSFLSKIPELKSNNQKFLECQRELNVIFKDFKEAYNTGTFNANIYEDNDLEVVIDSMRLRPVYSQRIKQKIQELIKQFAAQGQGIAGSQTKRAMSVGQMA